MTDPSAPEIDTGVVRDWRDDEGWGVLDSPGTPGGCWASFADVRMPGYRALTPGQQVWFRFEPARQDGFDWRATEVQLSGNPADWIDNPPPSGPSTAYRSTVTLTFADGSAPISYRGSESPR